MSTWLFPLAIILSFNFQGRSQFTLSDSLQLYYAFDSTFIDSSQNAFHGNQSGGVGYGTDRCGHANRAGLFDGIDDRMSPDTLFDYEERTVSVWLLDEQIGSQSKSTVVQDADGFMNFGFITLRTINGDILCGNGVGGITAKQNYTPNEWYHVLTTRNADTAKAYLNGKLVATAAVNNSASVSFLTHHLQVGCSRDLDKFWDGKIDEVRIYNRVLSSCEIRQLYCAAAPCLSPRDTIISVGNSISFINLGGKNDSSFWSINELQVAQQLDTFIQDFDKPGKFKVIVRAKSDCCELSDTVQVHVLPARTCLTVNATHKISDTEGNFNAILDNGDRIGMGIESIMDLNADGVPDIAVGSNEDDDGGFNRGAVYLMLLNTDGTVLSHLKISSDSGGFGAGLENEDIFGRCIAQIGDLNSDGIRELAVSASWSNDGGSDRGAVWIIFLNANGSVSSTQKISSTTGNFTGTLNDNDLFGSSLLGIPDLNGDGIDDLLVGAPSSDNLNVDDGSFWILFLQNDGTVLNQLEVSSNSGNLDFQPSAGDRFGITISLFDSLDNGRVKIMVGSHAYYQSLSNTNPGAFYILTLNSSGVIGPSVRTSQGENGFLDQLQDNGHFAGSISDAHDIDGDGFKDFVVGNWLHDHNSTDDGCAWLISVDSFDYVFQHKKITTGNTGFDRNLDPSDRFGYDVDLIGDINNDGYVDVAIGAREDDDGGTNKGALYLLTLEDTCCFVTAEFKVNRASICIGDTINLIAVGNNPNNTKYSWFLDSALLISQSQTHSLQPIAIGQYVVTLVTTGSNCADTQSIVITVDSVIRSNPDTIKICSGDSVQLTVSAGLSYQWDNDTTLSGDTVANPIAYPKTTTLYTVTITRSESCDSVHSFLITVLNDTYSSRDVATCDSLISPSGSSIWYSSGTYREFFTSSLGCDSIVSINLTILDSIDPSCSDSVGSQDSVTVDCKVVYPNILTPNYDGINDKLMIHDPCHSNPPVSIEVFNRWGQLVFQSFNTYLGWDGIINGLPAGDGVYYFIYKGENENHLGSVTLLNGD
ncbi:MAG: LamG-like jellyroll fold domain-containing protein [Flavobacteriales bacterium]